MASRIALLVVALGSVLLLAERVSAQTDFSDTLRGIMMKPPDQSPDLMKPPPEAAREQATPRSRSGPGYIDPLSSSTPTSRYGAAGWTVTPPPAGARATTDQAGALGFGFAVEWGAARPESP